VGVEDQFHGGSGQKVGRLGAHDLGSTEDHGALFGSGVGNDRPRQAGGDIPLTLTPEASI
jgi:hypothetical protein